MGTGIRRWFFVLTLLWGIADAAPNPARAATMLGMDNGGTLWDINPATAATSNPRNSSVSNALDLAVSPLDQRIFSANANTGTATFLFTVNRANGATTTIGPTGAGVIEGGMAFNAGGVLYAAWSFAGSDKNLLTLNTTTGAASVIGPMAGSDDVSALTFGKDGTLYALDSKVNTASSPTLYTLNPATGAILTTKTVTGVTGVGPLNGMTQDPDTGTFYVAFGGTSSLYTLNVNTGATTLVGTLPGLGVAVSGLAFIPEPSAVMLLACAAILIVRRRSVRLL